MLAVKIHYKSTLDTYAVISYDIIYFIVYLLKSSILFKGKISGESYYLLLDQLV